MVLVSSPSLPCSMALAMASSMASTTWFFSESVMLIFLKKRFRKFLISSCAPALHTVVKLALIPHHSFCLRLVIRYRHNFHQPQYFKYLEHAVVHTIENELTAKAVQ